MTDKKLLNSLSHILEAAIHNEDGFSRQEIVDMVDVAANVLNYVSDGQELSAINRGHVLNFIARTQKIINDNEAYRRRIGDMLSEGPKDD